MKLPTITEIAHQLGTSRTRVFNALRTADIIGSRDLAHTLYIDRGYFRIEYRGYYVPGTRIQKHYAITTVTPKGMALIQDLLDDTQANPLQGLRARDGTDRRAS